jgi:hypothetical protein
MSLDRAGLLAALALRTESVTLPHGQVMVRTLTAAERINMGAAASNEAGKIDNAKFSALMVINTVVDDAGERIFSDDDLPLVLAGASDVFEALFSKARALNELGSASVEAAAGN